MLPFTKRPGRGETSDVVSKDDLQKSPATVPPSAVKLSAVPTMRESVGDDEMTNVLEARSIIDAIAPSTVRPAAGRPATVRTASVRPPPLSRNANQMDQDADDSDDNSRTVVRGAPKIVKRNKLNAQMVRSTITPSARSHRRDNLLPGLPNDLLEDDADFGERAPFVRDRYPPPSLDPVPAPSPSYRPAPMSIEGPPSYLPGRSYPPPASSSRPVRAYPPPAYSSRPAAPNAVPAAPPSVPAHFMIPQAPHSDPPGTAVTAGHRNAGRPAASWAIALLACGLFVGVAAVAVAQSGDLAADTTAWFVDPSRAQSMANGGPSQPAQAAQAAPASTTPSVAPEPSAPPAAPASPQPEARASASAAAPGTVVGGFAPVAVVPATPAQAPKRPTVTSKAPAPAATPKAPVKTALVADEEPLKKAEPKPSPAKSGKKGGEADDETRKALEALQKAQLESASSFGND